MKSTKNNGITLISLVITIIVMLILVGVSIVIAENGGLYDYAENAVGETKNAIKYEHELINDIIDDHIKENVPGKKLPEGLKIGDYVNYNPKSGTYTISNEVSGNNRTTIEQTWSTETGNNKLEWRVWSIDEEKKTVELVSATVAQATEKIWLRGADGYNHGVDILNDLCEKLYSDTNGSTARSMNVTDINSKTNTTYYGYGDKKTPTNKYYPALYEKELGSTPNGLSDDTEGLLKTKDGVRNTDGTANYTTYTGSKQASPLNVTHTLISYNPETCLKDGITTGLINLGAGYWLASRCVYATDDKAYFGLERMGTDGNISYYSLYCSDGNPGDKEVGVRPILSLPESAVLVKATEQTHDGFTTYDIEF